MMEKITSRRNSLCMHVKRLGTDKGYRHANSEFICDGIKLLKEALKSNVCIKSILTANPLNFKLPDNIKVYSVSQDILNSISPLKNPQDILFICEMTSRGEFECSGGTHILLDSIQDPGNLGTIIRSADAFGMKSVILTGECADIYNPKTIRASMGSIFRQQILHMDIKQLSKLPTPIIATSPIQSSTDISDINLNNAIIAIGSEGNGLSDEILELCKETFHIATSDNCESLNAAIAASIIMWEART